MHEKEIINQIRNRNEIGINNLMKYYSPLIKYVIAPILPNEQDREECLSEVIMLIWDKINYFDESKGSWRSYITAIARNNALNKLRKISKENEIEPLSASVSNEQFSPEATLIQKETTSELQAALSLLSKGDRALFYRKYYYMQSTMQISAETALSPRAVEGRLYRIKKRLQKMLGGDFND